MIALHVFETRGVRREMYELNESADQQLDAGACVCVMCEAVPKFLARTHGVLCRTHVLTLCWLRLTSHFSRASL